jgi:hypothetical protein
MAREPIPNDPSGDELESLAEDLFGVSLNQDDDIEPFDVGDFDLDDDDEPAEPTATELTAETPPDSPSPSPSTKAPVRDAADDDFGAMLLDDDEAPPPPPKVVAPPPPAPRPTRASAQAARPPEQASAEKLPEVSADENVIEPAADAGEDAASSDEDDYWDALEGFDWDADSDEAKPSPVQSKKYVETTETFEDLIESADKTDEFLDDADFGMGLEDEEEAEAPRREAPAAAEKTEDESEAGEERKGRRRRGGRRRGRRGRSRERDDQQDVTAEAGDPEEASSAVTAEPRKDSEKPRRRDEEKPRRHEPKRDVAMEEGDGFGAGIEVETAEVDEAEEAEGVEAESTGEELPRKRRRRGGRRRGQGKRIEERKPDRTDDGDETETSEAEQDEEASDAEGGESVSRQDKYRSIPTWEEAISYLVRREQKKPTNGGKSASGSRRGRRGSGRRGS